MAIVSLDLFSYELAMNTQVTLILPERRGVPHKHREEPYPVLYLLHGHGQDHTSWLRLSRIESYLAESDVIVVMPNGGRGGFVDGVNTHRYGTYLTKELPTALKNWFHISTDREHTMIAGLSMGGYGALRAALAHPEQYGAVCALSAAIRMRCLGDDEQIAQELHVPVEPEILTNLDAVYGTEADYAGSQYDLYALAKALQDSGKPAPRILSMVGRDDPLCPMNRAFAAFLKEECPKLEVTYLEGEGAHNFDFWDESAKTMFRFFGLL